MPYEALGGSETNIRPGDVMDWPLQVKRCMKIHTAEALAATVTLPGMMFYELSG
jgi:hypothetical protein